MGQYKLFSASDSMMIHVDSVWIVGSNVEKELEKGCIRARRQMKRPLKLSRPVTERQVKAVAVHVVKRR